MRRWTLWLAVASLPALCAGCPEPPAPEPLVPSSASFGCADDGAGGDPVWTFEVAVEGPVDEARTTVFVQTEELPSEDGYAMTVQGGDASVTRFVTTVSGTQGGEEPAAGEVPFSCADADVVQVIYCATPEGRPDERPCWACGDGSGGIPPSGAEDWIACD